MTVPVAKRGDESSAAALLPGWRCTRAKYVFRQVQDSTTTGTERLLSVTEHRGVVPRDQLIGSDEHLSRAESLVGYRRCEPGDLVMNIMLAWKSALGVSDHYGIVSPSYAVFRPDGVHPRYVHYLLRSKPYIAEFHRRSRGIVESRNRLYPEDFGDVSLLLPPPTAQRRIAAFLDYETARIDELVREQQRLSTLASEQLEATTDTVLWQGRLESPSEQSASSSRHSAGPLVRLGLVVSSIQTGPFGSQLHAQDYAAEGTPLINPSSIGERGLEAGTAQKVDDATLHRLKQYQLRAGDLVLGRRGEMGRCALVGQAQEGWLLGTGSIRIRTTERLRPEFALHVLKSKRARSYFEDASVGSTMNNLNPEIVGRLQVPLLEPAKQCRAAARIEELLAAHDELVNTGEQLLALLRERRSALITAAVTGQIDVSSWRPPDDWLVPEPA